MKKITILSPEGNTQIALSKKNVYLNIDNSWKESYDYLSNYYLSKIIVINEEKNLKNIKFRK